MNFDSRIFLTSSLSKCREEIAAYKRTVVEVDEDVQPLTFWFSIAIGSQNTSNLHLSVARNSIDAERSVSQ